MIEIFSDEEGGAQVRGERRDRKGSGRHGKGAGDVAERERQGKRHVPGLDEAALAVRAFLGTAGVGVCERFWGLFSMNCTFSAGEDLSCRRDIENPRGVRGRWTDFFQSPKPHLPVVTSLYPLHGVHCVLGVVP